MSSSTRPSLSATYRRRFFQPGSPDWDSPFFEFVPWQFASWQRWRSGTKEVHPEQSTALLSMNPSQLFLVFTNADLLLLLLSNLTPDELNLLIQAGKGKTTLTEDFRRPLMRRHHALWLMGREFSVSEPDILKHPNHKLFDDLSAEKQAEHLAFVDFHACLLDWLSENQPAWMAKFLAHAQMSSLTSAGLLLGISEAG